MNRIFALVGVVTNKSPALVWCCHQQVSRSSLVLSPTSFPPLFGVVTNKSFLYLWHTKRYLPVLINYPQFVTATILEWKHLLAKDKYKQIIVDSLSFLVRDGRIKVYGFVIMPNHIHLLWHLDESRKLEDVQRDFLKFCGQKIKFDLKDNHPAVLERFLVDAKDRKYQIWERNPRVTDLYSVAVIEQKLNYIHNNPLQAHWNLAERQ